MSEFMFGIIKSVGGKPFVTRKNSRKIAKIAEANGATFVEVNIIKDSSPGINNGNYQAWFAGPNRGHPFDGRLAKDVEDQIIAAGIVIA